MTIPPETTGPQGDLLLRTMPMPADTSFNGDIFGGWIMSQMDLAGSMMAKEVTRTRTATVAVESMQFIKPVRVGDVVCCYGRVVRMGTTSVTIMLEVWVRPILHAGKDQFTTYNRKPSCGTTPSWRRRLSCVTPRKSWPSTLTLPRCGS